jgi:hypothetical protein
MMRSASAPRSVDTLAYPDALERAEARLVAQRRAAAAGADPRTAAAPSTDRLPDDVVGFGLSGGGVRSATFALGVFQSLARSGVLWRIDFLSTVSGGGYFGAFLGRLFTRPWVRGCGDVERVLTAREEPAMVAPAGMTSAGTAAAAQSAAMTSAGAAGSSDRTAKVFRWLRDNGRYLAPRGSGDLLLLGALLLRNWIAIQAVMIVSALTIFCVAQMGAIVLEGWILAAGWSWSAAVARCVSPAVQSIVPWSPWLLTALVPLGLIAVPAGWGYWLIARGDDGMRGVPAVIGAALTTALGLAGLMHYRGDAAHVDRLIACAAAATLSALAMAFCAGGELWVRVIRPEQGATLTDSGNRLRTQFTRVLKTGLVATGALLALGLVDTVSGAIYTWSRSGDLWRFTGSVAAAFAAVGAFARPLYVLLAPRGRGSRTPVPLSVVLWVAAVLVLSVWLVAVGVGAHALRWAFLTPACDAQPRLVPSIPPFLFASTLVLAAYTVLFGHTRRFLNLSSVHGFYTARITRAFLGASNGARLGAPGSQVSDTRAGDDCSGTAYWRWPEPPGSGPDPAATQAPHAMSRPWEKGGPLHLVNTTINETVDARTGIQNQDRKGTGLAVGPCALSVGVRHHLVSGAAGWTVFPRDPDAHKVFDTDSRTAPEPLSLGRWTSISGAAFSTAAGATTSVPLALLTGMFNVRLGYWWNSHTGFKRRWLERILPVQTALFDEMLAHTHGTAGRLWNISDGGHFENMGGYELLRRRLPIVVIVDAEADPDYTFQGLSDLVRKARLDFEAEIAFLSRHELDDRLLPAAVRPYFGDLETLRRPLRTDVSRAHAALARVSYGEGDAGYTSWLVYVKATLMGDEPEDVCHYHRAHPDFPQETTLDQFFDERQWESYRRLGQHIGHRVLTPELFDALRNA